MFLLNSGIVEWSCRIFQIRQSIANFHVHNFRICLNLVTYNFCMTIRNWCTVKKSETFWQCIAKVTWPLLNKKQSKNGKNLEKNVDAVTCSTVNWNSIDALKNGRKSTLWQLTHRDKKIILTWWRWIVVKYWRMPTAL